MKQDAWLTLKYIHIYIYICICQKGEREQERCSPPAPTVATVGASHMGGGVLTQWAINCCLQRLNNKEAGSEAEQNLNSETLK